MSDSDKLKYILKELTDIAINYYFDQYANAETSADAAERVVKLLKEVDKDEHSYAIAQAKLDAENIRKEIFMCEDSPIEEHEHWYVNGHDTGIWLEDAEASNFRKCPICTGQA